MLLRSFFPLVLIGLGLGAASDAPAQAALSERPIKVGAVFALSGMGAAYGRSELNATQLAVEEINQGGGAAGRRLELIAQDNQSSTAATVKAFNQLVSVEKVAAVVGPNWAEFAEVLAPLAEQYRVVLLTASGWTPTLTRGRRYVFTTLAPHPLIVDPLAKYIQQQGIQSLPIVNSENAYLESITAALRERLSAYGVTVEAVDTAKPGDFDYRAIISRLKKRGVSAVALALLQNENAVFLRQMREVGFHPRVFGTNTMMSDEPLLQNLHLADGVVLFDSSYLPEGDCAFCRAYRHRFGEDRVLAYSAPRAYDNMFLLRAAIARCGEDRQRIRDCLAETDYTGVTGRIRFDGQGQVRETVGISHLVEIKAGRPVRLP